MFKKSKGVTPAVIMLLIALGLIGGTVAGYGFREPIKKFVKGETTAEEIENAVQEELAKQVKDKFELEGVTTDVDASLKTITVKIKSSTNSIKELRLSEAPVAVSDSARITFGSEENLTITDIPINAQVHVGGTISEDQLTATKVIVQKEDAGEDSSTIQDGRTFSLGGIVKEVGTESITLTVSTANKWANSQKGKDLSIQIVPSTIIEKQEATIALADVQAGDNLQVIGTSKDDVYTASKIEIEVEEEAGELEESDNNNGQNNRNQSPTPRASHSNSGQNRGTETESNED